MALCTLHPSLSSLAFNLEAWEKLSLASLDSATGFEGISNGPQKGDLGPLTLCLETIQDNSKIEPKVIDLLSALSENDTVFYSEHFLSKLAHNGLANLLVALPAQSLAKISKVAPKTISEILQFWDSLGKEFGKVNRARDLHQRVESQLLDWTSNFYARLRGKRVVVLSSFSPLIVAGSWISDIIRRVGAIAPELDAEADQIVIDWNFLQTFDPHVVIIAPLGKTLQESKKVFFDIEKLPLKENDVYQGTAAAKRGEIYFAEGTPSFYNMDYRILKTLGVIVSACAGFESGYITERDTFYKLRHLELHRHKI